LKDRISAATFDGEPLNPTMVLVQYIYKQAFQMNKGGYGATAWADAGIICPYVIYKMYGDTRVIESHWASMTKYIDYLQSTSKEFIRGQNGYGDWLNLGGGAKSEVLGTAYSELTDYNKAAFGAGSPTVMVGDPVAVKPTPKL